MFWILLIFFILVLVVSIFLYNLWKDENALELPKKEELSTNIRVSRINTTIFEKGINDVYVNNQDFLYIKEQLHKKIIWQDEFINLILINILAGGNILVEWVPWLAKTKTISVLAEILDLDFKRIQFTPDMLPWDIIWTQIYNQKDKEFEVKLWPIFTNILLADEINRTSPKVQSALLESMQERRVSIWWETFELPKPFFVLATQNPLEQEWTYPLPEAQIDRFLFKAIVRYPKPFEEKIILDTLENEDDIKVTEIMDAKKILEYQKIVKSIKISDDIKDYIVRIVEATRQKDARIMYGASPRAGIWLLFASKALAFLEGRDHVEHKDVQRLCLSVLRHRIILSYDAKVDDITEDDLLLDLLSKITLE